MLRSTKTKIIGFALAGAVVLGGGIYTTTALAGSGAPATSTLSRASTQAAPTTTEWRSALLEMLQDHMGLTGAQAEQFADRMTSYMQNLDQNFDIQDMIDWCTQYLDDGGYGPYGPGMMDGYGYGYDGWGMMGTPSATEGGSTTQGSSAPTTTEPRQNGYGPGYGPGGKIGGGTIGGGMMGGGMMGGLGR